MSRFGNFPQAITQQIQEVQDDYSQFIIKPPDRNVTHGRSSKFFVVDSRDRDIRKYPNANQYRIDIPQQWREIVSAELIYGNLPNTYYNINTSNNIFYLSEDGATLSTATLTPGQYNNDKLLATLNGTYGNLFPSSTFTNKYNFTQNTLNQTLRIQSNRRTGIDFTYNVNYTRQDNCRHCPFVSVDTQLGFSNTQYNSTMVDLSGINVTSIVDLATLSTNDYSLFKLYSSNGNFRSTFQVGDYLLLTGFNYEIRIYEIKNDNTLVFERLDGTTSSMLTGLNGNIIQDMSLLMSPYIFHLECTPYVVLRIRDFQQYNSNNDAENSYTVIQLSDKPCTIINQATIPVDGVRKTFNPPLSFLPYMDMEFVNPDGTPFDFRGEDHMLVFKFDLLNQPGKYNNYVSVGLS